MDWTKWLGTGVDVGGGTKVRVTPDWVKVMGAGGFVTKQQYPLADVHGVVSPERPSEFCGRWWFFSRKPPRDEAHTTRSP